MHQFQFTPEPDILRVRFKKLMECAHDGFGCVNAKSLKAGQYNMFTADWIAGGDVNPGVWHEKFSEYEFPDGKLQSLYNVSYTGNPKYFAFMTDYYVEIWW